MERITVNRPAPSLLQEKTKQRSGMAVQELGTEHVAFSGVLERMMPQGVGDPPPTGRQTALPTESDSVAASGMAGSAQVLSTPLDCCGTPDGALWPEGSLEPSLEALSLIRITFSNAPQDLLQGSGSETALPAVALEGSRTAVAPVTKAPPDSSQGVTDLAFMKLTEGTSEPGPLSSDPLEAFRKATGAPPGAAMAALAAAPDAEATDEVALEGNPGLRLSEEALVVEPGAQIQKRPGRDDSRQAAVSDAHAEITVKPNVSEAEMPTDRGRLENVGHLAGIPAVGSSPGNAQSVMEWPEAPVTLQEMPELWLEQAKNLRTDGIKHLRLTLRPEHLGHLEIELRLKNGVLSGVVTVEMEMTHALIQKQWPQIFSALEAQQMNLGTFETLYKEGWSDHGPAWESPSGQKVKSLGSQALHGEPAAEAIAGSSGASGHLDLYA